MQYVKLLPTEHSLFMAVWLMCTKHEGSRCEYRQIYNLPGGLINKRGGMKCSSAHLDDQGQGRTVGASTSVYEFNSVGEAIMFTV